VGEQGYLKLKSMNLFRYLEGEKRYLLTGGEIHACRKYMPEDLGIQIVSGGEGSGGEARNRDFDGSPEAVSTDLFWVWEEEAGIRFSSAAFFPACAVVGDCNLDLLSSAEGILSSMWDSSGEDSLGVGKVPFESSLGGGDCGVGQASSLGDGGKDSGSALEHGQDGD
jgi:hypothetical protein